MAAKPNLLFIFTDEQRFDTLRCYGNDFVRAPNLNALAEESFIFQHPYVTQPVLYACAVDHYDRPLSPHHRLYRQ